MKSVYVIMKERASPIAICQQIPHEVQPNLKKAKERVDYLNSRSTTNAYWYERVKFDA